jgi:hypothetical protein
MMDDEISNLGRIRHMTPVWAVFDCGEIFYRLYADEKTANEAAKKLIAKVRRDMPDFQMDTYQVEVAQMNVHSDPDIR